MAVVRASVHPDWPRVEGKDCARCRHYETQTAGPDWVIECCTKHDRACSVTRAPMGKCSPLAKDWAKK